MSTSFERRRDYRHEVPEKIKLEYASGPFDPQVFEGHFVNISDLGLCILTSCGLGIGQEITLKDMNGYSQTARVEWIEKVNEGEYKAGLVLVK